MSSLLKGALSLKLKIWKLLLKLMEWFLSYIFISKSLLVDKNIDDNTVMKLMHMSIKNDFRFYQNGSFLSEFYNSICIEVWEPKNRLRLEKRKIGLMH